MKNILKKAENAEKLLNLTSDTMILLDRNGVCVDIAVHDINLWFLTEDQLLDKNILQLLPPSTYRKSTRSSRKCFCEEKSPAGTMSLPPTARPTSSSASCAPTKIWCSANIATSQNEASANWSWKRRITS